MFSLRCDILDLKQILLFVGASRRHGKSSVVRLLFRFCSQQNLITISTDVTIMPLFGRGNNKYIWHTKPFPPDLLILIHIS